MWRGRIKHFVLLKVRGVGLEVVCVGKAGSSAGPEHAGLSIS